MAFTCIPQKTFKMSFKNSKRCSKLIKFRLLMLTGVRAESLAGSKVDLQFQCSSDRAIFKNGIRNMLPQNKRLTRKRTQGLSAALASRAHLKRSGKLTIKTPSTYLSLPGGLKTTNRTGWEDYPLANESSTYTADCFKYSNLVLKLNAMRVFFDSGS